MVSVGSCNHSRVWAQAGSSIPKHASHILALTQPAVTGIPLTDVAYITFSPLDAESLSPPATSTLHESVMNSSLNARQRKALSEHAGVVILEFYHDDPPSWSQIGTQTQMELRTLVIDRLRDKACGDVAEILDSSAKEFAVRAIQQRFKSLREKKKREDKKSRAKAQGSMTLAFLKLC